MRFGFQISIAGGVSKVVQRAKITGCETIQLFSRNPRGWNSKIIDLREVKKFKEEIKKAFISPVFIHIPYLPNLASPDSELWKKSIDSLCLDLQRAKLLDATGVILHAGHRMGASLEQAIDKIIQAINTALDRVQNQVILIIENTAGEGTAVGYEFSQIKTIFEGVEEKDRLGVCLDTAHLYEAGYNIATLEGLQETVNEFDELVGLERLRVLHLNDSKTSFGSRKDRHWHIGEGYIGVDGFRNIINSKVFSGLPGIMETPRTSDKDDIKNMKVIRKLVAMQFSL